MSKFISIILLAFVFAALPERAAAQESEGFALGLGRYYMSVTPKILDDGLQNDVLFGLFYTDAMNVSGEIRLRSTKEAANDKVWVEDSLLTRESQIYELFFLPVNYRFVKTSYISIQAGVGAYYEYNKLNENGFFNDKEFFPPPGDDRYSSYVNDFTGHSIGPLLDLGVGFNHAFFRGNFSFGLVPIFSLNRVQHWSLLPFMNPNPSYSVSSESSCGPYYYMSLDLNFDIKYFSFLITLLNEYSNLEYKAAGFNITNQWETITEKIKYKKFALEISVLANLGGSGLKPQIGYGRIFDEVTGGSNYFMLGVKIE